MPCSFHDTALLLERFWTKAVAAGHAPPQTPPRSTHIAEAALKRELAPTNEPAPGNEQELAAVYGRYSAEVYGLALRVTRDPARAEEVTEDVFVAALRHRAALDSRHGSLRGRILTATRNRAIDLAGREAKEQREKSLPPDLDFIGQVEDSVLRSLDREVVAVALAALSSAQRSAVEDAFFGGSSAREIAQAAHLPVSTVKVRMRLGLQKLVGDINLRTRTNASNE
jgi:RNA polymerase sigma-70 factor, ECF subfamily